MQQLPQGLAVVPIGRGRHYRVDEFGPAAHSHMRLHIKAFFIALSEGANMA
jgi:hypothetical protein